MCKEININKSSGTDNISSKILKLALLTLSTQFTYIVNLSFQYSKVPDVWKLANVTPLFKIGDVT